MSDIGDAAQAALIRMNYGYWGDVSEDEIASLSRWIALFTMSHEFADRETVCIPSHVRKAFSQGAELDSDWLIAIGYAVPKIGNDPVFHRAFRFTNEDGQQAMIQVTIFMFGMLFCLCYHSVAGTPERIYQVVHNSRLAIIHPQGERICKPNWVHDESSIDIIMEGMSDAIRAAHR